MPENKKSWKEKQKERQTKDNKSQKAYQTRKEIESNKKPRKWPKGKIIAAVFVIILVLGIFAVWHFTTRPFTKIYIRADGSVDPSTAPISNVENSYYKFTADISGSIVVEKDNVIIDGNRYFLQGHNETGSTGIYLGGRSNVTITRIKLNGFGYGVFLNLTNNSVISENELTNNYSICFDTCSNNIVRENNITISQGAILLAKSPYNNITENSIDNNMYGINLDYLSNSNIIFSNNITLSDGAILLSNFSSNNTIFGNRIEDNMSGITGDQYSSGNIISGNNITNNDGAIGLSYSSNNSITENQINNNQGGIGLVGANFNIISGNNMTNNEIAIGLSSSANNSITENQINNNYYGINLNISSGNTIVHNSFVDNSQEVVSIGSLNSWDDGYPSGGNYWSEYQAINPEAEEIDDSGIWNTPYVIDDNNQDNYPVVEDQFQLESQ